MESALSWTSTNANHLSISILFLHTQKVLMWSSHFIECLNLLNSPFYQLHIIFHLPSSQQSSQRSHHHCHRQNSSCFFSYFHSGYKWNNSQHSTNTQTHCPNVPTLKGFLWCKANQQQKDDGLLAHLQSSHHPSLRQYLNRLAPSQDPICLNCSLEVQDLLHWLCECLAIMTIRERVFGNYQGSLEWHVTQTGDLVVFARKTLVKHDT